MTVLSIWNGTDEKEHAIRHLWLEALHDVDQSCEIKDMRKSVLKAKLMTILPTYNDKARELLERVVKRDPTDFEGFSWSNINRET